MVKFREIVIARYNEDISWSSSFKSIRKIYDKGDKVAGISSIQLPNVGREAHTYLYHIIHNWDNLAEQTLFCQGEVRDHHIKVVDIESFFEVPGLFKAKEFNKDKNWDFIHHIGKWDEEKSSGKMQKAELPFGEWFEQVIKVPRGKRFFFVPGAIFCVHRDAIKNHSKDFYKSLLNRIDDHTNPEESHYFERAWLYIFLISPCVRVYDSLSKDKIYIGCQNKNFFQRFWRLLRHWKC